MFLYFPYWVRSMFLVFRYFSFSKILNFIREMVLKIAKIQIFALVYLHIIKKTAFEARHTSSQSFHRCPSKTIQNSITSIFFRSLQCSSPVLRDSSTLDLWCSIDLQCFLANTNEPHDKCANHHGNADFRRWCTRVTSDYFHDVHAQ